MIKLYDLNVREHFLNKNFERGRSARIREIVIHHNASHGVDPYDTWQTREASAHYQVWSNGQIDQLVHLNDTAWHAHEANAYSVGIEHENLSSGGDWPIANAALHASAKLVGYLCFKLGLGIPTYKKNVTTHRAIETDGVGVDSSTACPGPYFLHVLGNPTHWYWTEARNAYRRARDGVSPKPPTTPSGKKLYQNLSVPQLIRKGSGQYLGLLSGPKQSHGGFLASERGIIKILQQRLIVCGFVPGVSDPHSPWADGFFEEPTKQAVIRFQKKHMPHTQFFGQVWYDDWAKLFSL